MKSIVAVLVFLALAWMGLVDNAARLRESAIAASVASAFNFMAQADVDLTWQESKTKEGYLTLKMTVTGNGKLFVKELVCRRKGLTALDGAFVTKVSLGREISDGYSESFELARPTPLGEVSCIAVHEKVVSH